MKIKFYCISLLILMSQTVYATKFTANVMGPLWLETSQQWQQFEADIQQAKSIGVNAITIDVWWGVVEGKADQEFDWTYYDKIFGLITKHDLKLIPIMSFHQCGGNVGDDCYVPIPSWLWTHFPNHSSYDLKYKSEQGNYSDEYLSLWANDVAIKQYSEFMTAFKQQYAHLADSFEELNVSMGPAGELRLPSYNQHDTGTNFPTRGAWQVYGERPTKDLQHQLKQQYSSIEELNKSWSTQYSSFSDIIVPTPTICTEKQRADTIDWFHSKLVQHGTDLLIAADKAFSGEFKNIPLGYKVPGIHWLMAKDGKWHRSAEIATGLIPSSAKYDAQVFGYDNVINIAKTPLTKPREVFLHFTTLEMSDNPVAPAYSKANTLVQKFVAMAESMGVTVKGENSLAAGVSHLHGWNNINQHFANLKLDGITVLRLPNITQGIGKQEYQKFIARFSN